MSLRYKGGVISATSPTTSASAATGVWTLQQQLQSIATGIWPLPPKTVEIKIWASGGAGGNYNNPGERGGPGGYATATFNILPGTVLSIMVGQGGRQGTGVGGDPNGGGSRQTDSGYWGGSGGGFTGIFVGSVVKTDITSQSAGLSSKALIIAGSGGGGSYYEAGDGGGYGGGTTGGDGLNRVGSAASAGKSGSGGTASAGGSGGESNTESAAGGFLKGGSATYSGGTNPGTAAGGGGAGWYGGGSGSTYNADGSAAGGGGGGSGMVASVTSGTSLPTGITSVTGNSFITQTGTGLTAPNNTDSDYVAGVGVGGGNAGNGGNGYIVIYVDGSKTTYSYTGSIATLTV